MPIRFACPYCGRVVKAGDTWAGKRAKCPGCGNLVDVPDQSTLPEAASPAETSAPPASSGKSRASRPEGLERPLAERPLGARPLGERPLPERPLEERRLGERYLRKPAPPIVETPMASDALSAPEPETSAGAAPPPRRAPARPQPPRRAADEVQPTTEPPMPKPKRKAAAPTEPRSWLSKKMLTLVSLTLGGVGFVLAFMTFLFVLPFLAFALCVLGFVSGAAAVAIAARRRDWNVALSLTGMGLSFFGGVCAYITMLYELKG